MSIIEMFVRTEIFKLKKVTSAEKKKQNIDVILPLFEWQALISERRPWWTSKMMHEPCIFAQGHWSYFVGLGQNGILWAQLIVFKTVARN